MAKKKGKHVSDVACYKNYKNNGSHSSNKIAKMGKIVKEQPLNLVAKDILNKYLKDGVKYTRNRKPILAGSKKHLYPTLKMNIEKQKKWESNKPSALPEWKAILVEVFGKRKPSIRVKNNAKRNSVPTTS